MAEGTDWACIDWQRPWLVSVAHWGPAMVQALQRGAPVAQVLNACRPAALADWQFVAQQALPAGEAYEAFIHRTRCIPTRDNLHDFFNGLMWLQWPQLKGHFNQLHIQAMQASVPGHPRGPVRDALTVFDENGALWWAPPALIEALQQRQWQRLMVQLRPLWAHSRLLPVGHALLEKLVAPRKPITAHVVAIPCPIGAALPPAHAMPLAWDVQAAGLAALSWQGLSAKPFAPLPVLGVPGWWAENDEVSFYDDAFVFRGARPAQPQQPTGRLQVTTA